MNTPPIEHPTIHMTIAPNGSMIVHLTYRNGVVEPLAFTNDADFSAWLKKAIPTLIDRMPNVLLEDQSQQQKTIEPNSRQSFRARIKGAVT